MRVPGESIALQSHAGKKTSVKSDLQQPGGTTISRRLISHSIKEIESEVVRTETVRWFREAMSNRLQDMENDSIICIMQCEGE